MSGSADPSRPATDEALLRGMGNLIGHIVKLRDAAAGLTGTAAHAGIVAAIDALVAEVVRQKKRVDELEPFFGRERANIMVELDRLRTLVSELERKG